MDMTFRFRELFIEKRQHIGGRATVILLLILASPNVLSAPSCEKNPKFCDPPPPPEEGLPIFKAAVSGMLTSLEEEEPGYFYTRPDQAISDPKNIGFSGNGSNEVKVFLETQKLLGNVSGDITRCFPTTEYSGSLQLYEDSSYGSDLPLLGRFWFRANSSSGREVQYVIEFGGEDLDWVDVSNISTEFPPSNLGQPIWNSAGQWSIRVTKKKIKDGCVSDGFVDTASPIDVALELVDSCEYPYDDLSCPSP